jgi:hypothetical protein
MFVAIGKPNCKPICKTLYFFIVIITNKDCVLDVIYISISIFTFVDN